MTSGYFEITSYSLYISTRPKDHKTHHSVWRNREARRKAHHLHVTSTLAPRCIRNRGSSEACRSRNQKKGNKHIPHQSHTPDLMPHRKLRYWVSEQKKSEVATSGHPGPAIWPSGSCFRLSIGADHSISLEVVFPVSKRLPAASGDALTGLWSWGPRSLTDWYQSQHAEIWPHRQPDGLSFLPHTRPCTHSSELKPGAPRRVYV